MKTSRETDLAWATGILDGEGYISIVPNKTASKNARRATMEMQMTCEKTVRLFAKIVGGKVHGPYSYPSPRGVARKPCWRWAVYNGPDVARVIRLLRPYLVTKRAAAARTLRFIHWRRQQPAHWRFTPLVLPTWLE